VTRVNTVKSVSRLLQRSRSVRPLISVITVMSVGVMNRKEI